MRYLIKTVLLLFFLNSFGQESFTDPRDNKTYSTLEIKGTRWMLENLEFTTENSREISSEKSDSYNLQGHYYHINDLDSACPVGWRLPQIRDWVRYFEYIAETESQDITLSVRTFNNPYRHTITGYKGKFNPFNAQNLLNLQPTGKYIGDKFKKPSDFADFWTKDTVGDSYTTYYTHILEKLTTIHASINQSNPTKNKKSCRFMIRCVRN